MLEMLAIVAFIALGLLAMRYGYDSRDGFRSKEEELASHGFTWDDLADPQLLPLVARERHARLLAEVRRARLRPDGPGGSLRAGLARRLHALADRLESGSTETETAHA